MEFVVEIDGIKYYRYHDETFKRYAFADNGTVIKDGVLYNPPYQNEYQYISVYLSPGKYKRIYVHKVMAEMFLPNPNPETFTTVYIKNGDRSNLSVTNLAWGNNVVSERVELEKYYVGYCVTNDDGTFTYKEAICAFRSQIVQLTGMSLNSVANAIKKGKPMPQMIKCNVMILKHYMKLTDEDKENIIRFKDIYPEYNNEVQMTDTDIRQEQEEEFKLQNKYKPVLFLDEEVEF